MVYGSAQHTITSSPTVVNISTSNFQFSALAGIKTSTITFRDGTFLYSTSTITGGSSGGGATNGTINSASQFSLPYYSLAGSSTTVSAFPGATVSTNTGVNVSTLSVSTLGYGVLQSSGNGQLMNAQVSLSTSVTGSLYAGNVTSLTASTNTLQTNINAVGTATGTIQSQLTGVANATGTIQTQLTGVETATGTIQTQVTSIAASTGTLATAVASSTSSIQTQVTNVANATGTLVTVGTTQSVTGQKTFSSSMSITSPGGLSVNYGVTAATLTLTNLPSTLVATNSNGQFVSTNVVTLTYISSGVAYGSLTGPIAQDTNSFTWNDTTKVLNVSTIAASSVTVSGALTVNGTNYFLQPLVINQPLSGTTTTQILLNGPFLDSATISKYWYTTNGPPAMNRPIVISNSSATQSSSFYLDNQGEGGIGGLQNGTTFFVSGNMVIGAGRGTQSASDAPSNGLYIQGNVVHAATTTLNGYLVISSGVITNGSSGTSGQIFTSNGPGTIPTWQSGAGGNSIANQNTLQAGATFYTSSGSVATSLYLPYISGGQYLQAGTGGLVQGINVSGQILSQNTLQAGTTFFTSSGSVAGNFTAGTVTASTFMPTGAVMNVNAPIIISGPSQSTVTYGLTVGSETVNGPGNGVISLTIAGSTYTVASSSSVPIAGNYLLWTSTNFTVGNGLGAGILNQSTLQAGASFYTDFGTVNTSFTVNGAAVFNSSVTFNNFKGFTISNASMTVIGNALYPDDVAFSSGGATAIYTLDVSTNGHINSQAVLGSTVTSCGGGASFVGSDTHGTITTGSGSPTACTYTFLNPFTNVPDCFCSDNGTTACDPTSISKTAVTFGLGLTETTIHFFCIGSD